MRIFLNYGGAGSHHGGAGRITRLIDLSIWASQTHGPINSCHFGL